MLHSVEYAIDPEDRLIHFGGDWNQFARENDGATLTPENLHMHNLFDYIQDPASNQLWRFIIQRVRDAQNFTEFDYRCDSAVLKRFMKMRVSFANGNVHFKSTVMRIAERPEVKILERAPAPGEEMLIVCSWCRKVKITEDNWLEPEVAVKNLGLFEMELLPGLSHGICPECMLQAMAQFEKT
jgi:hypothetical protein